MAAITVLPFDASPPGLRTWQLAKSPSIAQTAITAAKLSQNFREASYDEATLEAFDVSMFNMIRVQVWANGSNNHAPVIDVYGFNDSGPGAHVGQVTTALGNFTSAASTGFHASSKTHSSITGAFDVATAYRGCDTYTITADNEQQIFNDTASTSIAIEAYKSLESPSTLATASVSPVKADFPAHLQINLSRSRFTYMCLAVTNLGSATTVGAIYRGVSPR